MVGNHVECQFSPSSDEHRWMIDFDYLTSQSPQEMDKWFASSHNIHKWFILTFTGQKLAKPLQTPVNKLWFNDFTVDVTLIIRQAFFTHLSLREKYVICSL